MWYEGFEIFPGKTKIGHIIVMRNKCVKNRKKFKEGTSTLLKYF